MILPEIGRRQFLAGGVGTLAGTLLASCGMKSVRALRLVPGDPPDLLTPECWRVTACGQCPGGCGIRVRVVRGEAVGIAGLPSHPVNRGGLCPRGVGSLQVLYHPKRLRGPMRRSGPRGSGRYTSVTWDEALETLVTRLSKLRKKGSPQGLVILGSGEDGQTSRLLTRFAAAFGTPNVTPATASGDGPSIARLLTQRAVEAPAYDWERVRYVLSLESNWLEARNPPEVFQRAHAFLRRGTPGFRGKTVEAGPRFTFTAAQADEWVPLRPGTSGALAMAIGHALVSEGEVDEARLSRNTLGYSAWSDEHGERRPGFRELILDECAPEWAERVTGVPAARIRRLAREIADHRPAVVLGPGGPVEHTNRLFTEVAVQHLNALLGSIGRPGGALVQREPPYAALPDFRADELARQGAAQVRADGAGNRFPLALSSERNLPHTIRSGRPYPVEVLLLHRTNPVLRDAESCGWRDALERVPFVASFGPFLDETSRYADLILPDHSDLELREDKPVAPSTGFAVVSMRVPVLEPLYDTRQTGEVVLEVARRLGGAVSAAFPWPDFRSVLAHAIGGLAGKGTLEGVPPGGALEAVEERGYWSEVASGSFGSLALEEEEPSKYRFVGFGPNVVGEAGPARGAQVEMLGALDLPVSGDRAFLSRYAAPRFVGDPGKYPLLLLTYRISTLEGRSGAVAPLLKEAGSGFHDERFERRVEVHPATARSLGLGDGDRVRVVSPAGRLEVRLRAFSGLPPDAVALPVATGGPEDANRILADLTDEWTGAGAGSGTRVRLERIT